MNRLERITPEEAGIDSEGIAQFVSRLRELQVNLRGFMLLRHGKVAAEGYFAPYHAAIGFPVYSVSKSITSAAVGIAIGEGLLSLEDRVVDYFPEKLAGKPHPYVACMEIRHLLAMMTVHRQSTNTDGDDWIAAFLNTEPSHPPGTLFHYDTTGTHTLCGIVQKVTGHTVHQYLQPRLFEPLGMESIEWSACPMNINKGGSGIRCTLEDMARFGQLYLQDGIWQGTHILPAGWVELSTSRHADTSADNIVLDGKKGYGYQFWRLRNQAYAAYGMGGQFIIVMPNRQAVFSCTANTLLSKNGHQAILDCVWEALYPAMDGDHSVSGSSRSIVYHRQLAPVLPQGQASSPMIPIANEYCYQWSPNSLGMKGCRVQWKTGELELVFTTHGLDWVLRCGIGHCLPGRDFLSGEECASSGIWADEDTFVIFTQLLHQVHTYIWVCRFDQSQAVIQIKSAEAGMPEGLEYILTGTAVSCGKSAGLTIYLAGDSTVADYPPQRWPMLGWGGKLASLFDVSVRIVNGAINGRSSRSFIEEGRLAPLLEHMQPGDIFLIQFGHNDSKDDPQRYTDPWGSYRHYLKQYIDGAKQKGAYPVLISPVSRRHFNDQGELLATHGDYPEAMSDLARQEQIPYIDLCSLTAEHLREMGAADSRQWFAWLAPGEHVNYPEGISDDTHLNELGALAVAKLVLQQLSLLQMISSPIR